MKDHAVDRSGVADSAQHCVHCGSHCPGRLYAPLANGCTCEHCLLERRKQSISTDEELYGQVVEALAAALDLRERETGLHSKRVACHTLVLAKHCYTDAAMLKQVYWGSLLHDIGKIGVSDAILLKNDRLTDEEWTVIRQHPGTGYDLLAQIPHLATAAEIVLCHEERFDGSGYPRGLRGNAIPLPARLFAVIDTLDAITSNRPYRQGVDFDAAKSEIVKMSGRQFDPAAVEVFLSEEECLREMVALQCAMPFEARMATISSDDLHSKKPNSKRS